jgi:Domain of unknown function (DUF4129)
MVTAGRTRAQDNATSAFLDSVAIPPRVQDSAVVETSSTDTVNAVTDSSYVTTDEEEEDDDISLVDSAIVSSLKNISPDSIALIKKDKGFYYQPWLDSLLRAEDARGQVTKKRRAAPDLSFLDQLFNIFQVLLWIAIAAILIFLVYRLFLGKNALLAGSRKNVEELMPVKEEEEMAAGSYERLIKKAEAENNFRLAVRYHYLGTLAYLAEKGVIRLGADKTNYQYAAEIRKTRPGMAHSFADITRKYEYVWYGEYPVTSPMYDSVRESFNEFKKQTT